MKEQKIENTESPGVDNSADTLFRKLQENKKSLHIARVPDKTKETFKLLAEEEFCGDYGMLLKDIFEKAEEYKKFKEKIINLIKILEGKKDAS